LKKDHDPPDHSERKLQNLPKKRPEGYMKNLQSRSRPSAITKSRNPNPRGKTPEEKKLILKGQKARWGKTKEEKSNLKFLL